MLKFSLLSDVHLEFYKSNKLIKLLDKIKKTITEKRDILLLAGDIGKLDNQNEIDNYKLFLNTIAPFYNKILLVPGNHEYYDISINEADKKLLELETCIPNLKVLNNNRYTIDRQSKPPISILGSIMWGCVSFDKLNLSSSINDFHKIIDFRRDPLDYIKNHNINRNWLENQLKLLGDQHDLIVMNHHVPSNKLSHPKYARFSYLNSYYCSNLDHLFNNKSIKYWVYGHTHTANNSRLSNSNINFLCNPYGYPGENDNINYFVNFNID